MGVAGLLCTAAGGNLGGKEGHRLSRLSVYCLAPKLKNQQSEVPLCLNAVFWVLLYVLLHRRQLYDLDKIPGPWQQSFPVVGNVLECLR